MVQNGDKILIPHNSYILERILCDAVDQGKQFTLYLLSKNTESFQKTAIRLQLAGIKIIYGHVNNVPFFIKDINKVFMTNLCVYSNGSVLTEAGSAGVAIFAEFYKKPVYLFTRTYKFSSRTEIDSFSLNLCCPWKD